MHAVADELRRPPKRKSCPAGACYPQGHPAADCDIELRSIRRARRELGAGPL